jgi:gentisate 1,2-dioxygenase
MAKETENARAAEAPALANDKLAAFAREIAKRGLSALWERTAPQRPGGPARPMRWRYAELRPHLLEAAELITKRAAERRVLVLENPGLDGAGYAAATLYAGLQIILPGEVAPAHRHSQNALRFLIEGEGAYTAVGGERTMMRPGDFIVTPAWDWHDHGNLGNGPCVWLDGLDTPFAQFFGAIFREDYPTEVQPLSRASGDSAARYGSALLPVDARPTGKASPILNYPYERSRAALDQLSRAESAHRTQGWKLRYANPVTGGHVFPTMAAFLQKLPENFAGAMYRSTESAVFTVVEGAGRVTIGDQEFDFSPHDTFVVPAWTPYRFAAARETFLFSYSDRAAQEALGFFREAPE